MGSLKRILEDRTGESYEQRIAQLEAVLWPLIDIVEAELESDPEPDGLTSWKMVISDARAALETVHVSNGDTGGKAVLAALQLQETEAANVRLRDEFAMAALTGIRMAMADENYRDATLTTARIHELEPEQVIASMAYEQADAMLALRAKGASDA